MSKTVFIFGAGASVEAGAPTMKDFLDVAEQLKESGKVGDAQAEFNLVFKALSSLSQAQSKATLNLQNIEEVFAAFEMAKLIGKLDPLKAEEIALLPEAMRRVIVRTLEKSVLFPVEARIGLHLPEAYERLRDLLARVAEKHPNIGTYISIITFNYDICLDMTLFQANIPPEYYLGESQRHPNEQFIALLKLHGSLNWFKCPGCGKPVPWKLENYWRGRFLPMINSGGHMVVELSQKLNEFHHCGDQASLKTSYVVPPTWNKSQYHGELESVWAAAARELSTAENIVVCGYSLPLSDHFFRQLYALGTISDRRIKKFLVFDPDKNVEARFVSMLGQAAIDRFSPRPYKFDGEFFDAVEQLFT